MLFFYPWKSQKFLKIPEFREKCKHWTHHWQSLGRQALVTEVTVENCMSEQNMKWSAKKYNLTFKDLIYTLLCNTYTRTSIKHFIHLFFFSSSFRSKNQTLSKYHFNTPDFSKHHKLQTKVVQLLLYNSFNIYFCYFQRIPCQTKVSSHLLLLKYIYFYFQHKPYKTKVLTPSFSLNAMHFQNVPSLMPQ